MPRLIGAFLLTFLPIQPSTVSLFSLASIFFCKNDSVTVVVSSQSGKELSHAVYAVVNNMITISTALIPQALIW